MIYISRQFNQLTDKLSCHQEKKPTHTCLRHKPVLYLASLLLAESYTLKTNPGPTQQNLCYSDFLVISGKATPVMQWEVRDVEYKIHGQCLCTLVEYSHLDLQQP